MMYTLRKRPMTSRMALEGRLFRTVIYNSAAIGNLDRIKVFTKPHKTDQQWLNECLNDNHNDKYPLVIAARNGFKDVVDYFLDLGADPSVRGSVEFDNDNIMGTPALWAASAAGHLEIVKLLVEKANADVNQTTNTQSTPLRGACYDGHLEIVRYLLQHGANPHIPNRHGHTCLMIAAYRHKVNIVEELLTTGIDVNMQTERGNAALHDAAESGDVEVVKLLLGAGAKMLKDIQGVDPLICAAQSGYIDIIEVLADSIPSALQRRDALKLLGATLLDKKMDAMGAMECWRKALEVPLSHEETRLVSEMKAFFSVQEVYDYMTECHELHEVELLEGNIEAQRMQALVIRERILGGSHTDVHYYLRFRGAVYCDMGNMEKCYELWRHALELQQKHFSPLHVGAITTLQSFQETFGMTLNDFVNQQHNEPNLRVKAPWVEYIFNRVCFELERVLEWGDKPLLDDTECCGKELCLHATTDGEIKKLVVVAVQLINVMDRLSLPSINQDPEEKNVKLDLARFLNACEQMRVPLLQYALEERRSDNVDLLTLPKASVLDVLLDMNLDVNSTDKNGDTPMHIVLRADEFRNSLLRSLLSHGAALFARNNNGKVVMTEIQALRATHAGERRYELGLGRYITLAGICANQMKVKYAGMFDGVEEQMPPELRRFYSIH